MDRCNWDMLNNVEWRNLLMEYPQFFDKCDKWNEFNEDKKEELIDAHPDLAKYFPKAEKKVDNNQLELF